MISFRIFAFNTWTVMWKPPFVKRRGEGRKCGENNSRDLLILWSKLMKIFHFTEWIKVCDDGTFTVWLRTLYSSTTWCWGELSASHLPHYTLLFMKGALYLKLGALSSWSLMRAVTVLHKHCLSPLWTSGFDRLWWAVTSLIRLIYFKLLDGRRRSLLLGWSLPNFFLHSWIHVPKKHTHTIYCIQLWDLSFGFCLPQLLRFILYYFHNTGLLKQEFVKNAYHKHLNRHSH